MNTVTQTPWLPQINSNPRSKLRLFCLPYAGGSTYIYDRWSDLLPDTVEVCPIELPGRRKRFIETPYESINILISDLAVALLPYLDKPFAIFGHSMGGLVSFELTRLLRRRYHLQPVHLFISACRATQLPRSKPTIHNLDNAAFTHEIIRLGGTPEAVLNDKEMMELILPVLKADFKAIETHTYQPETPLELPITVFGGDSDTEVTPEELAAWRSQTTNKFSLEIFTGGHFFIDSKRCLRLASQSLLLNSINTTLDLNSKRI